MNIQNAAEELLYQCIRHIACLNNAPQYIETTAYHAALDMIYAGRSKAAAISLASSLIRREKRAA